MPHPWSAGQILTAADLNAIVPSCIGATGATAVGPTSGTTPLTVLSVTIPTPGVPGRIQACGHAFWTKSVQADTFQLSISIAGAGAGSTREAANTPSASMIVSGTASNAGSGSITVDLIVTRVGGTGTATMQNNTLTSLQATFIPN